MRKQKQSISSYTRAKVLKRDGYRCRYCGSTEGPFHIDHVYPESKGGVTAIENLVTSCKKCNLKKHSRIGVWPSPLGFYDIVERAERGERFINKTADRLIRLRALGINLICLGVAIMYFIPDVTRIFLSTKNSTPVPPPIQLFGISVIIGMAPVVFGLLILILNRRD